MKSLHFDLFSDSRINKYVKRIIDNKFYILIISVTLLFIALIIDMEIGINSSLMALLPQNTPSIKRVKDLEKKTGGFGDLILMIQSPDKQANISYAENILPQIQKLPWVDRAGYRLNDSIFTANKLLYINVEDLEEIRNRINHFIIKKQQNFNPLFVDLLDNNPGDLDFSDIESQYSSSNGYKKINANKDSTLLLLVIHPQGMTSNISFAKSIYNELNDLVTKSDPSFYHGLMEVNIGGTYKNRLDEYNTILHDVSSGFIIGAIAILVLLLIYFRRISLVFCLLIPLFLSLAVTFAISELFIGDLNLITAFLFLILFGLGIDFGIHILNRYICMRKKGNDHKTSLANALQNSGKASLTAALTTVSSFYFLMFSNFLGFRHFGFIAGTGVIVAYAAYMIIFPALLTIFNDLLRGFKLKPSKKISLYSDSSNQFQTISGKSNYRFVNWLLLFAVFCFTIICLWFTKKVSFEYDFRNLRSQITSTREFNKKMRTVFKEARDPSAVIVKNATEADKIIHYINEKKLLGTESPVYDIKSINDIIPSDQKRKLEVIKEIKTLIENNKEFATGDQRKQIDLLEDLLVDSPLSINQLPQDVSRLFTGLPGTDGQLVYIYQSKSLLDIRAAKEFSNAVGEMNIEGKIYNAISEPIVFVDLINILEHDSIIAIIGTLLVILLIILMHFKKFCYSFLLIMPVLIGLIWMLGLMGMLSIKLNLFNMVILPGVVGLGVDSSVHIFHRFREKGRLSIHTLLTETGSASFICTLTTLVGFGGLLTASHPGLKSLGTLAIIGLSACLLTSLLILPSIMGLIRRQD